MNVIQVRKNFADSRLRVKGRFVKKEDEEIVRDLMNMVWREMWKFVFAHTRASSLFLSIVCSSCKTQHNGACIFF